MRASTLVIAIGVVLLVFPEPATSGLGLLLILVGLLMRFV
ncbi:transporter [Halomarina litorea]